MGLELGEGHFDRVEIGRVLRQKQEPGALGLQALRRLWTLVDGEVVEDDHVAALEGGSELGLDVAVEGVAIDGAVDDPGCVEAEAAQAGDEGLGLPAAERRRGLQALASGGTPAQPRHLRGDGRFINEDKPMRLASHPWLTPIDPFATPVTNVRPAALGRQKLFFYMYSRP